MATLVRGCGTREKTAIYWTLGFSKAGGVPLETYLMDPPILVESFLAGQKLTSVGVQQIWRDGVLYLVDRIGTSHYPTVPHFVEECRHYGVSRRLSSALPFDQLSAKSRLFLVHDLAAVEQPRRVAPWSYPGKPFGCPKGLHDPLEWPVCLGACWSALPPGIGTPVVQQPHLAHGDVDSRSVIVTTKTTAFRARRAPQGLEMTFRPAVFMSVPCGALEVIRAPEDAHQANVKKAGKSPFPVIVCDE